METSGTSTDITSAYPELGSQMLTLQQARLKKNRLGVRLKNGRLVIKETPRLNLLLRLVNWLRNGKGMAELRMQMLEALASPAVSPEIKKQIMEEVTSSFWNFVSQEQAREIKTREKSFFRTASVTVREPATVELTDINGKPEPKHACMFVSSPQDKLRVQEYCRSTQAPGQTLCISKLSDFEKDDLIRTIVCDKGKNIQVSPGRLFQDKPLTLVIDFTSLSPADMASLNELFDTPPRFQGRLLSQKITLVSMVGRDMLSRDSSNPGPDFWRRMDRLGIDALPEVETGLIDDHQLLKNRTIDAPSDQSRQVDFYQATGNWQIELFGGMHLSPAGDFVFKRGALAQLGDPPDIELVNAPWDDPEFVTRMATMVRNGGFWANNRWVDIPDNFRLARKTTAATELNQRLEQLPAAQQAAPFICVNGANFAQLMSNIRLQDGLLQEADNLADALQPGHHTAVMVSGSLSTQQWAQLIARLEQLHPHPGVMVAPGVPQPTELKLNRFQKPMGLRCKVSFNTQERPAGHSGDVFEYTITPATQSHTLLCGMPMLSQQGMRFQVNHTPLLQAMKEGRSVRLHGLETNPEVACELETLLSAQPYVMVQGDKIDLPDLRLNCITAPGVRLEGLWHSFQTKVKAPEPIEIDQRIAPPQLKRLQSLMRTLKRLPASKDRRYPDRLPEMNTAWLHKLGQQLELEKRQDGSDVIDAYHWRKALNDVLAKEYRGDPQVYNFIKGQINAAFPEAVATVAADQVRRWLADHPGADAKTVQQYYWELARFMSPACLPAWQELQPPPLEHLAPMLATIVQCVPEGMRETLVRQLNSPIGMAAPELRMANQTLYRKVYNALMAAGPEGRFHKELSVHEQAEVLSGLVGRFVPENNKTGLKVLLQNWFSKELLADDFRDLPEALLSGGASQYRQKRRVARLAAKLSSHHLVMLKGEAGTGKTFTAHAVAASLSDKAPMVISLGPEHSQEDLFGCEQRYPRAVKIEKEKLVFNGRNDSVWAALCECTGTPKNSVHVLITFDPETREKLHNVLEPGDAYVLQDQYEDFYTEFKPGPLLEWAEMNDPPVLILDEANLVRQGVLEPLLQGLQKRPPQLSIQGKVQTLTDRHRIILTGNPDYYDGRIVDAKTRESALTLYYRPMSETVLLESIVAPGLPDQWTPALKKHALSATMALYQQYQQALPLHTFGPRDIRDILARIKGYCPDDADPSDEVVNAAIWQALNETLGGELLPGDKSARALKHWFQSAFPCDFVRINQRHREFSGFYQGLLDAQKTSNKTSARKGHKLDRFDYKSPSVKTLAGKLWSELEKQGGKNATIVEGEAGRGKDELLNRILPQWLASHGRDSEFYRINASADNWEEVKAMALKAMEEGKVLVISELNILPSRYIEGLFNEVLGGKADPNFKLVATINPPEYSGREKLSEAMQSRCTVIKLPSFSDEELRDILARRYPRQSAMTEWLVTEHCRKLEGLKKSGSTVNLTLAKLLDVAETLSHLPEQVWQPVLDELYLLANISLEGKDVEVGSEDDLQIQERQQRENHLSGLLNDHRPTPLVVELLPAGSKAVFDSAANRLSLPDDENQEKLLHEATRVMLAAKGETGEGEIQEEIERLRQVNTEYLQSRDRSGLESQQTEVKTEKTPETTKKNKERLRLLSPGQFASMLGSLPVGRAVSMLTDAPVSLIARAIQSMPPETFLSLVSRLPAEKLMEVLPRLSLNSLAKSFETMTEQQQDASLGHMNRLVEKFQNLDSANAIKQSIPMLTNLAGVLDQQPVVRQRQLLRQCQPLLVKLEEPLEAMPDKELRTTLSQLASIYSRVPERMPDSVKLRAQGFPALPEELRQAATTGQSTLPPVPEPVAEVVEKETVAPTSPSGSTTSTPASDRSSLPLADIDDNIDSKDASGRKPLFQHLYEQGITRHTPFTDEFRRLMGNKGPLLLSQGIPMVEDMKEKGVLDKLIASKTPGDAEYEDAEVIRLVDVYCKQKEPPPASAPAPVISKSFFGFWNSSRPAPPPPPPRPGPHVPFYQANSWQLVSWCEAMKEAGGLSQGAYRTILGKLVFDYKTLPVSMVVGKLSELQGHPFYGDKAEAAVRDYYENVVTVQRKAIISYNPSEVTSHKLGLKLDYLEKRLRKTSIERRWKDTPTRGVMDVNRAAQRFPAFPASGSAAEKQTVVMPADYRLLRSVISQELVNAPELVATGSSEKVVRAVSIFLVQSLGAYQDSADWQVVVQHSLNNSPGDFKEADEFVPIWRAGVYGTDAIASLLLDGYRDYRNVPHGYHYDTTRHDFSFSLEKGEVLNALGKPNAIYLDETAIRQCVRDLIKQLKPEDLPPVIDKLRD